MSSSHFICWVIGAILTLCVSSHYSATLNQKDLLQVFPRENHTDPFYEGLTCSYDLWKFIYAPKEHYLFYGPLVLKLVPESLGCSELTVKHCFLPCSVFPFLLSYPSSSALCP